MVTQIQPPTQSEVIYPDSDGQPVANNTIQFRWIVEIQQNLDWLFAHDPDVLVVIGRPKGDRLSYMQWKEAGIPPQVVFEILSPSNSKIEMEKKLLFYDRYGVEEYYIYDPEKNYLQGWLRSEEGLDVIPQMADFISPRLKIRFVLGEETLHLYHPDGTAFLTYGEIAQRAEQERQRAEQERQRAERLAAQLRALGVEPEI
jgi:hypothetical protein